MPKSANSPANEVVNLFTSGKISRGDAIAALIGLGETAASAFSKLGLLSTTPPSNTSGSKYSFDKFAAVSDFQSKISSMHEQLESFIGSPEVLSDLSLVADAPTGEGKVEAANAFIAKWRDPATLSMKGFDSGDIRLSLRVFEQAQKFGDERTYSRAQLEAETVNPQGGWSVCVSGGYGVCVSIGKLL
jgi:hypothetical protein